MGYKIVYGPKRKTKFRGVKWSFFLMTGFFFLLFTLFAHYFFSDALQIIRRQLFPSEQINALVEELSQGLPAIEAISAFCEDLFHAK